MINLERLTEDEFLFIWEPVLGLEAALGQYHDYKILSGLEDIDFGEDNVDTDG